MRQEQELIVITKTYDLILWSSNHTSRFPRKQVPAERAECKVQAVVLASDVCARPGRMKCGPGGSGRPQGSNAPPGLFFVDESRLERGAKRAAGSTERWPDGRLTL